MKLKFVKGWQKDETVQNNHKLCGSRSNNINCIPGGTSIATFVSGVGLPVGIALSETSLLFPLATAITQKSCEIFTIKQDKPSTRLQKICL